MITINEVQQVIEKLENAGELSMKEEKYLALAKAFKQMAAENMSIKAMNDCLSDELRGYESDGAFEGPKMHLLWWQVETPATDRIVAGIKADGVEEFAALTEKVADEEEFYDNGESAESLKYTAKQARLFAKQLREGAK